MNSFGADYPAAGQAVVAARLQTEHHCPDLPEPGRWAR